MVTKLRAEGCGSRIPAGEKGLSLQNVLIRCGALPLSYSKVRSVFPGIKVSEHDVDYASPSSVNFKNEWSYVSAPPRAFVECLEASPLFSLPIPAGITVFINQLPEKVKISNGQHHENSFIFNLSGIVNLSN
jgi:hypothetical protein